jgi:ketosteroid isomerase-like protein
VSVDLYDPEDRQAMIARYAELGGGLSALGDTASERALREFALRFARAEIEPLLESTSPDYAFVDHRQLGWDPVHGRDGFMALAESAHNEGQLDLRFEVEEVLAADQRVVAALARYIGHARDAQGGEFSVDVGVVCVFDDGRVASVDQYEPENREAMLARYTELTAPGSLSVRMAERLGDAQVASYAARDWDAYVALHAEDFRLVDHRPGGWGTIAGRDELRAHMEAIASISADVREEVEEVLAYDDRVLAARCAYRGHAVDGGGAFEIVVGYVNVYEDGLVISTDVYDPEDRQAMIARYVELGGQLAHSPEEATGSARG